MAKTFIAQSVSKNHDWDFTVDDMGKITAFVVRSEVNYGAMGRMESLNVWKLMDDTQKSQMQSIYDKVAQAFGAEFL